MFISFRCCLQNKKCLPSHIRDERTSFRGTTRNSPDGATFDADTSLIINGITRRTLLNVQAAAPGRKPGIMCKRLTPFRSRYDHIADTRQPNLSFSYISEILAHQLKKSKDIFHFSWTKVQGYVIVVVNIQIKEYHYAGIQSRSCFADVA